VVSRAELALRTVTATIPEIERQIALKENETKTLLGRNPGTITRTSTLLAQEMPVEIPVGLPSSLLERRPDVCVANAEIGVAIGDFFPRIGLTTLYGGTSTDLDQLLKSEANIWSAAATAAGPVFTGSRLTDRHRQTKGAFEQAKLSYQQTVLSAFREDSDALISHRRFNEERTEEGETVAAGREAVAIFRDALFNHGIPEPCYSVKIDELKKIQERIKVDHRLALDLYDIGVYDAMHLAELIADDAKMTKKDLQHWADKASATLARSTVS